MSTSDPSKGSSTTGGSKGSSTPPPMSTSDPSKGSSKGSSTTPPPMSTSDPSKGSSTTSGGRGGSTTGSPGRGGLRRIHPLRRRLQMEATMNATFTVAVEYPSMDAAEDITSYINSDKYTDDMNTQLEQSNSVSGVTQTSVSTPQVEDAASTNATDGDDDSSGSKALTIGIVLVTTAVFVFLLIVCPR